MKGGSLHTRSFRRIYTSLFLATEEIKMALRARTLSGAFEKRAQIGLFEANGGLKVNRGNNFSSIKMLSTAYVLCSLRLLMLKTEGQNI